MTNKGTPPAWKRDGEWRYGPTKIVVSQRPDMAQTPETAGEVTPSPRRPLFHPLIVDLAFLVTCAAVLGALYLLADWMVQVR